MLGPMHPAGESQSWQRAALFDMDKTLIRKNSATLYKQYERDLGEAPWSDVLQLYFWLFQYSLGLINAEKTALRALSQYRGMAETKLIERCTDWYPAYVKAHVSDEGRAAVERHRNAGDFLVIVTASTRYSSAPLGNDLGMHAVVATELELDPSGTLTGHFIPPLCYGTGKVERTERLLSAKSLRLKDAAFYTDSISDLPLLEVVREPFVVNPDPRLKRVAQKRGYPILSW
jgi:HAD superfamily hydrolase (TIGR01490 family)